MDYNTLISNSKITMKNKIKKLFKRIENNKDILHLHYVYEDLKKLELEISRTLQRMGH